jgi:hypothetical protein
MVSTSNLSPSESGRASGLDSNANNAAPWSWNQPDTNDSKQSRRERVNPEFRAARWEQRRIARIALKGTRCAKCGRPCDPNGVGLYFDETHGSRFGGLQTCGNVWCCPVCNAKIQAQRQTEIYQALKTARDKGLTVVFATHTIRHNRRQSLDHVRAAAQMIWRKTRQHAPVRKLFKRFGSVGYIRAMECTWSNANGWHVHFHAYYFFKSNHFDVNQFGQGFSANWIKTARDNGEAAPLEDNQRFEIIDLTHDLDAASRYVTTKKTADLRSPANELVNGQSKVGKIVHHTNGSTVTHYSYWDLLRLATALYPTHNNLRYAKTGSVGTCIIGEPKNDGFCLDLPRIMKLLKTYYRGMKFARALVWSRGLRDLLDVGEEQTDDEIAAQEFTDPKNKVLVIWNWNKRLSRSDYIAAELLNFCDSVHGDSEACADWCRWYGLRLSPQPVMRFGKVVDD